MGASKRFIRTSCAAALLTFFSTGHAFATEIQEGIASFYSDRFQGSPTASGVPFDQQALTAAHPTLPFWHQGASYPP